MPVVELIYVQLTIGDFALVNRRDSTITELTDSELSILTVRGGKIEWLIRVTCNRYLRDRLI